VPSPTLEQVLRERVAGLVGDDLEAVEADVPRELYSPVALIQEMGGYIASAGGKRLRPILLLLAARVAGYRGPRGVRLACVVDSHARARQCRNCASGCASVGSETDHRLGSARQCESDCRFEEVPRHTRGAKTPSVIIGTLRASVLLTGSYENNYARRAGL